MIQKALRGGGSSVWAFFRSDSALAVRALAMLGYTSDCNRARADGGFGPVRPPVLMPAVVTAREGRHLQERPRVAGKLHVGPLKAAEGTSGSD